MLWEEWEPIYREIVKDMGYSQEADETSARMLRQLTLASDLMDPDELEGVIGEEVTVYGFGNDLEDGLGSFAPVGTVIVADSAVRVVMEAGVGIDIIVTDLDGDVDAEVEANAEGAIALIHAHGDNVEALQRHVPRFKGPVIPTTQGRPGLLMPNFGGFTDGDRAVCLARHFGARRVHLVGFDLDVPRGGNGAKARKLQWARKIIFDLCPGSTDMVVH